MPPLKIGKRGVQLDQHGITERSVFVVNFIRSYQAAHFGQAPTTRELATASGLSTSIIARYLRRLHKQGVLVQFRNHYCLPRVEDWYTKRHEESHEPKITPDHGTGQGRQNPR